MYTNTTNWLAYAAARGESAPSAATVADQDAALQRADDYIRRTYVRHFDPLVDVSEAGVAADLAEAVHVAASLELAEPGLFSKTFTVSDLKTLTQVGELEWEPLHVGDHPLSELAQPKVTSLESLLRGYLIGNYDDPTLPDMGAFLV